MASLPCASRGQPGGLGLAERVPLVEGLSRLAAELKGDTVGQAGRFLVESMVLAVDSFVQHNVGKIYTVLRHFHICSCHGKTLLIILFSHVFVIWRTSWACGCADADGSNRLDECTNDATRSLC